MTCFSRCARTAAAAAIALWVWPVAGLTHEQDPENPDAKVPPPQYRSVVGGYRQTPVRSKPADWRELNERAEQIGGPRGQLRDRPAAERPGQ